MAEIGSLLGFDRSLSPSGLSNSRPTPDEGSSKFVEELAGLSSKVTTKDDAKRSKDVVIQEGTATVGLRPENKEADLDEQVALDTTVGAFATSQNVQKSPRAFSDDRPILERSQEDKIEKSDDRIKPSSAGNTAAVPPDANNGEANSRSLERGIPSGLEAPALVDAEFPGGPLNGNEKDLTTTDSMPGARITKSKVISARSLEVIEDSASSTTSKERNGGALPTAAIAENGKDILDRIGPPKENALGLKAPHLTMSGNGEKTGSGFAADRPSFDPGRSSSIIQSIGDNSHSAQGKDVERPPERRVLESNALQQTASASVEKLLGSEAFSKLPKAFDTTSLKMVIDSENLEFAGLPTERTPIAGGGKVIPISSSFAQMNAQPIIQAIAVAIETKASVSGQDTIELLLEPQELGRLRITFVTRETGLFVLLSAERSETLDMLRRNADELLSELDTLDLGSTELGFEHSPQARENPEEVNDSGDFPESRPEQEKAIISQVNLVSNDRLDIRL